MDRDKIVNFLKQELAEMLKTPVEDIDEEEDLLDLGIQSMHAMRIIKKITQKLCVELNPASVFEATTIEDLSRLVIKKMTEEKK